MKNIPQQLAKKIEAARKERGDKGVAQRALSSLDLTSLKEDDTQKSIKALCKKARTKHGYTAAVCVYPAFVKTAADNIPAGGAAIATVINFPDGDHTTEGNMATPENTAEAIAKAVAAGATEIDIVFDYKSFLNGNSEKALMLLRTADDVCRSPYSGFHPALKVIMESAAFNDYNDLHEACALVAKEIHPDFLKTSTGKHPGGGATLESGAILLDVAARHNIGVKISGGVSSTDDCAHYLALADNIMGSDKTNPAFFRFGASGVINDLLAVLDNISPNSPARKQKTPGLEY